ncbi:hypothetical protein VM98_04120 [Streptomyces rubellomurinus subsp. indigoferus]|nr:hypothetical protein VM98_04120 [Streptomyces rubellomurinus subsp. indigoferus]
MDGDNIYGYQHAVRLEAYYHRRNLVRALAALAVGGWLWAVGLLFVPAHASALGDEVDCGSPALYEKPDLHWQREACDQDVAGRTRDAVTVTVLTLPLAGAWIHFGITLRDRRAAVEAAAGE